VKGERERLNVLNSDLSGVKLYRDRLLLVGGSNRERCDHIHSTTRAQAQGCIGPSRYPLLSVDPCKFTIHHEGHGDAVDI